MHLSQRTPFKQIARIYTALLGINESLAKISLNNSSTQNQAFGMSTVAICDRLDAINASVDTVAKAVISTTPSAQASGVAIHNIGGLKLLLDSTSLVDRLVIERGEWEGDQVRYMTQLAERFRHCEKTFFLDLGSYWGYYSLMMQKTGVFEKIYAFDADALNFSQLQANIFLNQLDDVIIARHAAVSHAPATLRVQASRSHADGNRGATRVLSDTEEAALVREVQAVAVDDVLDINGGHILIKMDVEAHEASALRGLRRTIANNKVFVQVEIYKEQTSTVMPVLEELGLRQINAMYPDFFFTNIPVEELGY